MSEGTFGGSWQSCCVTARPQDQALVQDEGPTAFPKNLPTCGDQMWSLCPAAMSLLPLNVPTMCWKKVQFPPPSPHTGNSHCLPYVPTSDSPLDTVPSGHWKYSRLAPSTQNPLHWVSPKPDLGLSEPSETRWEAAGTPLPETPGVHASGCILGPTAQLTGTWPPLLQGYSHPLLSSSWSRASPVHLPFQPSCSHPRLYSIAHSGFLPISTSSLSKPMRGWWALWEPPTWGWGASAPLARGFSDLLQHKWA